MSRLMKKRGFSLNETAVVIVILGCLIAITLGIVNASKIKNDTLAIKQAKLESAVRTATMSILGQDKISATQACSPETMRDKYAEKISGSKVIDDVEVNGEKIPALEVQGYGILAFDKSADCESAWYATGSTPASAMSKSGGSSVNAATSAPIEPAAPAEETNRHWSTTQIGDGNSASEATGYEVAADTLIESPVDLAKSLVIYSSVDANASDSITVPGEYTANGRSATTEKLSANAMVFNVTKSGAATIYATTSSPILTRAGSSYNNDISICSEGSNYNFTSSRCTGSTGAGIQVNFYQMIDESSCRRSFCPGNGYDNEGNLVTSGQINLLCKLGSGTVGQCECPGDKKFWVGIYAVENSNINGICIADCAELGMVADSETTCKCEEPKVWSNTLKQCVIPGTCPYDYLKNENGVCVCKTEAELGPDYFDTCEKWINDPSQACKTLRDNWDKTTGTCVCPSPFTISGKNCICTSPRTLSNGVCSCDATKVDLSGDEIFDTTSATCKFDCSSINQVANPAKTACVSPECGCLKTYDVTAGECVCDSAQANNAACLNSDEKYDETSVTCKSCKSENREYSTTGNGACVCKDKAALALGTYEIYDPTQENCIYTCKDGAVANADHTKCIGGCLQEYNYTTEKLECIQNPSDAKTAECLQNTNSIYSASARLCSTECSSLTTADSTHKVCACDRAKVAVALNQPGNLNKVYDLDNAPACMLACTGQNIPNSARTACRPVDCLYETTDNITQHCKANPTDAEAAACLTGTNYISDPTAATCKVECEGLTSPNSAYKECKCDSNKVTRELARAGNENKIADMDNAPSCVYTCKDGARANSGHTECIGDCLQEYDYVTETLKCIQNPSDAKTTECLRNTNYISDPSAATCKVECSALTSPNGVYKQCNCDSSKVATELAKAGNEDKIYDLTNAPTCIYTCKDGARANDGHTECIGDCLQQYNYTTEKLECIPNPSDAKTTECLINTNFISDPSAATCKVECSALTSPNGVYKECKCNERKVTTALNQAGNLNKIYDLDNAPTCMMACQGQTFPNDTRTACRPVDCLYETTDNITQHCIANPSDELTAACLATTNYISSPASTGCQVECTGLTGPNAVHKQCTCDNAKVTAHLMTSGNENKIYDMNNAPTCVYECKDGAVGNSDRTACIGDCLQQYNYTTEKLECIPNPSDAKTTECLRNTNYVYSGSSATCKVACSSLTSPNSVYKQCNCDQAKVATALTQQGNLNKIYALDNAPACMVACTGQTFPNTARTECRAVDCLYETTDNITQHCKANPSDAETTRCLQNTNYKSNPSLATCKEDCGTRRSPNNVYKTCNCDIDKMATLYSSNNMKFDATSSTCESACPSSFTSRDEDNPSECKCPRLKPSQVTVQAGYYYDATSRVLAGTYACQLECPTTRPEIADWMWIFKQYFIDHPKAIYSSIHVGCIYDCEGNYVPSDDKLECICGITANDCAAGTYFDANACECKPCPVGHYCPGPVPPINCPCGTYGSVEGLSAETCSGECPAGYYCPEASVTPTARPCPAGYTCPAGHGPQFCAPRPCTFPSTSQPTSTVCDRCQTEAQIRAAQPNYFGENEVYVNNLALNCKQCKSNMVYDSTGKCACPPDIPYWNGQECTPCKQWGTLYFARQGKNKPSCTLYNHMMGKAEGGCFDHDRVPSNDMKQAANALSAADKARTFNGVYAYMVSYKNGVSTVEGVFTARSWYHTFSEDISSADTKKTQQAGGTCAEVCGSNTECVNTCNYMKGQITTNTMFNSCIYAVNNQYYADNRASSDSRELCTGGQIVVVRNNQQCLYGVGGILRQTISPLVLDLKGDGFKYTSVEDGVVFDLNNDGVPEKTGWTAPQKEFDNAFLVLDKNKNGQVDNGGELFGDQNGSDNGFIELAKYDDNGDDVINKEDKIFNDLRLWVDFNKNAKVDYEADGSTKELKTLDEAGVTEISVNYELQKDSKGNILRDIYGNITGFLGSFKMMVQNAAGKLVEVVRKMMDVFFVTQ
ncbi:MAG: hypothetical protein K6A44_01470 [bacterium]|nr:hypothetical protein [bacterium]